MTRNTTAVGMCFTLEGTKVFWGARFDGPECSPINCALLLKKGSTIITEYFQLPKYEPYCRKKLKGPSHDLWFQSTSAPT